ncbi:MAG: hypothetical protein OHK0029_33740 [Armatimonadaceae bacterium]
MKHFRVSPRLLGVATGAFLIAGAVLSGCSSTPEEEPTPPPATSGAGTGTNTAQPATADTGQEEMRRLR